VIEGNKQTNVPIPFQFFLFSTELGIGTKCSDALELGKLRERERATVLIFLALFVVSDQKTHP